MEIHFDVPFMTISRFAERTGLSVSYVKKKANEGTYPILPKEKKQEITLINIVELVRRVNTMNELAQQGGDTTQKKAA